MSRKNEFARDSRVLSLLHILPSKSGEFLQPSLGPTLNFTSWSDLCRLLLLLFFTPVPICHTERVYTTTIQSLKRFILHHILEMQGSLVTESLEFLKHSNLIQKAWRKSKRWWESGSASMMSAKNFAPPRLSLSPVLSGAKSGDPDSITGRPESDFRWIKNV